MGLYLCWEEGRHPWWRSPVWLLRCPPSRHHRHRHWGDDEGRQSCRCSSLGFPFPQILFKERQHPCVRINKRKPTQPTGADVTSASVACKPVRPKLKHCQRSSSSLLPIAITIFINPLPSPGSSVSVSPGSVELVAGDRDTQQPPGRSCSDWLTTHLRLQREVFHNHFRPPRRLLYFYFFPIPLRFDDDNPKIARRPGKKHCEQWRRDDAKKIILAEQRERLAAW